MAEKTKSAQPIWDGQEPRRSCVSVSRKHTAEERLAAICPLLNVARTEELIATRAAEVGTTSRTLHRWIAAVEGRAPGSTRLKLDFPGAASFVVANYFEGTSAHAIHQLLKSEWPVLHPGKPCPCYSTILSFVRSLKSASKESQL
jgi:hypothetical protein